MKFLLSRKHELLFIAAFFVIWRLALFGFSFTADHFLLYHPSFPYYDTILPASGAPRWLYSWGNFDGVHYLTIGEKGYVGTGLVQAFFPLFPYVLLHSAYVLSDGQINVFMLGMSISNLAAFLLCYVWFYFVKSFTSQKTACFALVALFLFPTAFFLGALYTESLFLLTTVAAFFAARKKLWLLAAVCAGLAVSTRVVGIFLLPALVIELFFQRIPSPKLSRLVVDTQIFLRKDWKVVLMLLCSAIGLLMYMSFLQKEFHDPLYFSHVQEQFGGGRQNQLISYPQVVWRALKIVFTAPRNDLRYFIYVQELVVGVGGFVALLFSVRRIRFSYFFFALCAFLLPTTTGTFSSLPRYFLVCFFFFFLLGKWLQKNPWRMILCLSISSILLIVNTLLFIQGYWVA